MALTVPTIAEPVDDEVPASVPRHKGNGRPKIRHLDDPTQMSYWVRASSFAERVDDMFRLDRRNERLVARGMAISPDLCELAGALAGLDRSEEHTSELQSRENLVCRLLREKKKQLC